jgi:hypothetical protein
VHEPEFPAIKLQIMRVQAVLKTVKLEEPAFTERNAEVLPAQVLETWHLKGIIQIEPLDFA